MTIYKLIHDDEYDEWVVKAYVDGKFDSNKSYYTTDRRDAEVTMAKMKEKSGMRTEDASTPKFRDVMIKKNSPLMKKEASYSDEHSDAPADSNDPHDLNPDHPMYDQPEQCAHCYEDKKDDEPGSMITMDMDPGDAENGPDPDIDDRWICDRCTSYLEHFGKLPGKHAPSRRAREEEEEVWHDRHGNPSANGAYDAGGHYDHERGMDSHYGEEVDIEDFASLSESILQNITEFKEGSLYLVESPRFEYRGNNKKRRIVALPPSFITGRLLDQFEQDGKWFVRLENNKINDQQLAQYGLRRVEKHS